MKEAAAGPIPVTVLTGFLGAGKTTLLNAWLRDPTLAGTAIIVNEFGEIGIDDALVESASGDMLSLVTGCVCCAARGDLVDALAALLGRRGAGDIEFSRAVIETTGLADPGPVWNALLLAPDLAGAVAPAGIVTVVSTVDGETTLDRHPEARRQAAMADHLVLSRTDLPEGAARAEPLMRRLATLAPVATIWDAPRATADASVLLSTSDLDVRPGLAASHQHHHHGSDARIRSVVLQAEIVDRARLETFLALVFERWGSALLRLKGLAAVAGDADRPVVIQAVGPFLYPAGRLRSWPDGRPRTRLVAILEDREPATVAALWTDLFGPPAIDRPDAAALMAGRADGPGLF